MIYFENSMLGMRGFHLLVPESQTKERTNTDLRYKFCWPKID